MSGGYGLWASRLVGNTSVSVVAPTRLCLGRKGKEEKIKLTTSKREIRPEVKWKLENSKIGNNKCANV